MKSVIRTTALSLAVIFVTAATMLAQGDRPRDGEGRTRPKGNDRPNIMKQLDLSEAQLRQVRQLNVRRRPLMDAAQVRFREASRLLDEAIYADQLNEAEVQDRIKEVQQSQSELIRMRSMSELMIRKILTPDQLIKFRRLRQRFQEVNSQADRQAFAVPMTESMPMSRRPFQRK